MLPYLILFAIPAWLSLSPIGFTDTTSLRWSQLWRFTFVVLVLMVGLRHQVGVDWFNYLNHIRITKYSSLQEIISGAEPVYNLLNWIASHYGGGMYFVNTISGLFFAWGLVVFCRAQPRPWLAMTVAIPYLVIVVGMGYNRQGVAVGLGMMALVALGDERLFRFAIFLALAAAFHKSALLLAPLVALSNPRNKLWNFSWILVFIIVLYNLLLENYIGALTHNYIEQEQQSAGAAVRILMSAVPGTLFLLFRNRFGLSKSNKIFWTWMSFLALGFVILLNVSPSSTAVDRVALYLIPLQLFVYSRIPDVLGKADGGNQAIVFSVIAYSATVLLTWLLFADHAGGWLPYRFYPLVWLLE